MADIHISRRREWLQNSRYLPLVHDIFSQQSSQVQHSMVTHKHFSKVGCFYTYYSVQSPRFLHFWSYQVEYFLALNLYSMRYYHKAMLYFKPVHDIQFMDILDATDDLMEKFAGFLFWNPILLVNFGQYSMLIPCFCNNIVE